MLSSAWNKFNCHPIYTKPWLWLVMVLCGYCIISALSVLLSEAKLANKVAAPWKNFRIFIVTGNCHYIFIIVSINCKGLVAIKSGVLSIDSESPIFWRWTLAHSCGVHFSFSFTFIRDLSFLTVFLIPNIFHIFFFKLLKIHNWVSFTLFINFDDRIYSRNFYLDTFVFFWQRLLFEAFTLFHKSVWI